MVIGEVRTFPNVEPDKQQVLKILEEAAEVFSAWENWEGRSKSSLKFSYASNSLYRNLLNECADVIQATSNLLASLGIDDFEPLMQACEERNEKRGRYDIH